MKQYKLFLNGKWQSGSNTRDVYSPFSQKPVARVEYSSAEQMNQAITVAEEAFKNFRRSSRYVRSKLLNLIAEGISERRTAFVDVIVSEAGKPTKLADAEVSRAITTFTVASEEAKRFTGEVVPIDFEASGEPYQPAVSSWVPRGPVLAITPFNFPLNLVAHKVAPAFAVGTSVLLKPPPQAPGAAVLLAEVFEKACGIMQDQTSSSQVSSSRIGQAQSCPPQVCPPQVCPPQVFQVLSCANDVAELAVTDPHMSILSFTGSPQVGWLLQSKASRKKVILELGGNAGVIVHKDANLTHAAARCAYGAFAYAGQVCISVQRIFVQKDVASEFQKLFLDEVRKIAVGDPAKSETVVGPIIDEKSASRIMDWIDEAKSEGAKILYGGKRNENIIEPTVLTNVKPHLKISSEEAFGPVVLLDTYDNFNQAIDAVNHSRFGLQAGVFTDSSALIRQATENLEVGGIMINEVPTFRADNMPYGGMKESGLGREGVRYTMEEYCERRTVVTRVIGGR